MNFRFLLPLTVCSLTGALACPAIPGGQFLSHATSRPAGLEVDCSIENTLYQRMYQKEDERAHLRYFEQFRVTSDPA